ncbi:MAG: FAD-dependent oxidoreductase [Dehalococcoidales bacterium]|nr:FAD-dependent oxidoreductase [Dehalococcoidales bacterium]
MDIIKINIDGQEVETQAGKTVLEASLEAGIYIPHLCYHPDLSPLGACRLCVVEIEGIEGIPTSCTTPVCPGMAVKTKTEKTEEMRRMAMELMLAGHPSDCGTCNKYLNCELQSVKQYLVSDQLSVRRRSKYFPLNTGNPLFVHDANKCVVCGRCVRACHELRGAGVLFYKKEGKETYIGTASGQSLAEAGCRFCGACAEVCPTGAIQDKEELVKGKNRRAALVPCKSACPAEIDVPGYIRFINRKDYSSAVALIREKVPFPGVLGYCCDHPCEAVCRRGEINQPVAIRELKLFAAGNDKEKTWTKNRHRKPSSGKKVAVIGSGPAGLTAAFYLALQGHELTVFETLPLAGGMMRYGIPQYRLPREMLDGEIRDIEEAGVELRTGTTVDSVDKLFEEGYNAILIAVGTHRGQRLKIQGADNPAVLIGVDFLRDVNQGKKETAGKKVVVLGGGNVAFDCARVARRLGAEQVHLACLECETDMPASEDEIKQGQEEGIIIHPAHSSTQIICREGEISGVEFMDVASFSFDEEKNPQIELVDNSQHIIEADSVIIAIGQSPVVPEGFRLETGPGNLIEIDPYSFTTNRDGVYAAGDAVSGSSSLIKAMASGRKTAMAIDRYLEGDGKIEEKLAPAADLPVYLGPGDGFAGLEREEGDHEPVEKRLAGFCTVEKEMEQDAAEYESGRCLQCDLRLKIKAVKFWGNY